MLDDFAVRLLDDFADDWYGVWEFDWALNSLGHDRSPTARVPLLKQFAELRLIDVFHSNWDIIRTVGAAPLSKDEAIAAVADYSNWRAPTPDDELFYIFTTNGAGEALVGSCFSDGKFAPSDTMRGKGG